ncbi:G-protein coupled adenosine receptor activity protein [Homalodisca vitripennis]|nr:G-protein coupled adenosine receptor activity protein [Homalodisca vitripennis]
MVAGSAAGAVVAANATYPVMEINIPYVVSEVAVAFIAVIGNLLVILAFRRERRLRRRTNYYIVSLAAADLLVGLLGIPCALLTSVGLPPHKHVCLFTTSLLVVLCTISIFSLVAVSVDRYWAILYPMGYSRNVRTKTAIVRHYQAGHASFVNPSSSQWQRLSNPALDELMARIGIAFLQWRAFRACLSCNFTMQLTWINY